MFRKNRSNYDAGESDGQRIRKALKWFALGAAVYPAWRNSIKKPATAPDAVEDASRDSSPASDPPAWNTR